MGRTVDLCRTPSQPKAACAATLAGIGPWNAEGLDWLAGMGEGNLKEFDLVLAGEEALRPAIERERGEMLGTTAEQLRDTMAPPSCRASRATGSR